MAAGGDDRGRRQRDPFSRTATQEREDLASIPITTSSQRRQLVDEAMDAYIDWREECIEVSDAYALWSAAGPADAVLAFRGYAAALDREEAIPGNTVHQVAGRLIAGAAG